MNTIYETLLDPTGLNTIIYNDPYAKLCLISTLIVELKEEQRKKILYIDLDTVFTAFVRAGLIPPFKIEKINSSLYTSDILRIYIPDERIHLPILDVIRYIDDASLIIFDSVTSFYSLFQFKMETNKSLTRELGRCNQSLLVLLMLLLKNTKFAKIPLLVTSMIRYKRKGMWTRSPTANRFLSAKSTAKLYVRMENENDIAVNVLSHPNLTPQKFILPVKGIKILSES
ncbi:MAG TPA: hypothetical protein VF884_05010 [Nitrososphaeraceae archaeon]